MPIDGDPGGDAPSEWLHVFSKKIFLRKRYKKLKDVVELSSFKTNYFIRSSFSALVMCILVLTALVTEVLSILSFMMQCIEKRVIAGCC